MSFFIWIESRTSYLPDRSQIPKPGRIALGRPCAFSGGRIFRAFSPSCELDRELGQVLVQTADCVRPVLRAVRTGEMERNDAQSVELEVHDARSGVAAERGGVMGRDPFPVVRRHRPWPGFDDAGARRLTPNLLLKSDEITCWSHGLRAACRQTPTSSVHRESRQHRDPGRSPVSKHLARRSSG